MGLTRPSTDLAVLERQEAGRRAVGGVGPSAHFRSEMTGSRARAEKQQMPRMAGN